MGKDRIGIDDGFSEIMPEPPSARRAGIGDNLGPEWLPIGPVLDERLNDAHAKILKRAEEVRVSGLAIKAVDTPAQLKTATERVRQIQASMVTLDNTRKVEKEPYRLGGSQVDGVLGTPFSELETVKRSIELMMDAYNRKVVREARAKAAAEAEKRRKEQEAALKLKLAAEAKAAAARKKAEDAIKAAEQKKMRGKTVDRLIDQANDATRAADEAADLHEDKTTEVERAHRTLLRPAALISRSRSTNAVQSQQEYVDFRALDKARIQVEALLPFLTSDMLATALRGYIQANGAAIRDDLKNRRQPLRGVEFFINTRTRVGG